MSLEPVRTGCPKCGGALVIQSVPYPGGSGHVSACTRCGGMWMDHAACWLLCSVDLQDQVRDFIRAPRISDTSGGGGSYRERPLQSGSELSCPVCRISLAPYITVENVHGVLVEIDICPQHGTWFDNGEAPALLSAIELIRLSADYDEQVKHAGHAPLVVWPPAVQHDRSDHSLADRKRAARAQMQFRSPEQRQPSYQQEIDRWLQLNALAFRERAARKG